MAAGILTKHWEKRGKQDILEYAGILKQRENKKVLETMMAMASIGQLTPERDGFFMAVISDQRIGENDVHEFILRRSSERGTGKE